MRRSRLTMAGVVPVLVLAGALGGCAASSRHPAEIGGFGDVQTGQASFYADRFEGRLTASGETFRQDLLTAAHRTLPFGTRVRVTNLVNRRAVVVRINDRGPFVEGRIIDLSRRAAEELDFVRAGLTDVKIEVLAGS